MRGRALSVLLPAVFVLAGCTPGHAVPLYNLFAVNTGPEDRLIVLGNSPDGASTQPTLVIPADGRPRSTRSTTIGSQPGANGVVLVYDPECTLLARVEVEVGSWLLTVDGDQATLAELARVTEPAGAELAGDAPRNCPGGAPP